MSKRPHKPLKARKRTISANHGGSRKGAGRHTALNNSGIRKLIREVDKALNSDEIKQLGQARWLKHWAKFQMKDAALLISANAGAEISPSEHKELKESFAHLSEEQLKKFAVNGYTDVLADWETSLEESQKVRNTSPSDRRKSLEQGIENSMFQDLNSIAGNGDAPRMLPRIIGCMPISPFERGKAYAMAADSLNSILKPEQEISTRAVGRYYRQGIKSKELLNIEAILLILETKDEIAAEVASKTISTD